MNVITRLSTLLGVIGAGLLAITGVFLTYEVIARYFFIKPTIWGCLLAMAWVLILRQHITVNALTSLMPRPIQHACVVIALTVIVAFSSVIVVWGWDIFYESWERGRTTGSLLDLPSWVAELPVPLGFLLLGLQAVCELFQIRSRNTISLGGSHE